MAKEEGRDSGEKGKTLTAIANISWVDNNGDEHSAEVPVMDVAISDGWVRAWWILNSKANLSPSRFGRKEATHLARLKDLRSRFKSK